MFLFLDDSVSRVLGCEIAIIKARIDRFIKIDRVAIAIDSWLIHRELLLRLLGVCTWDKFKDLDFDDIFKIDCHSRLLIILEGQTVFEKRQSVLTQGYKNSLIDLLLRYAFLSCVAIRSILRITS